MQLNISELEEYEQIPENMTVPIKVIKKNVHFEDRPMHQTIPKEYSKMIRPQQPPERPKISYEDILSKMGMFVSDGKLHLVDRNSSQPQKQQELNSSDTANIPQNNYIYNKFFKDELQPQQHSLRQPRTLEEYKRMVVEDYIKRQHIKQMKSTKLIMPTSNINISARPSANLNKLFSFPKR